MPIIVNQEKFETSSGSILTTDKTNNAGFTISSTVDVQNNVGLMGAWYISAINSNFGNTLLGLSRYGQARN